MRLHNTCSNPGCTSAQGKPVGRMEFVLFTDVSPRYRMLCHALLNNPLVVSMS